MITDAGRMLDEDVSLRTVTQKLKRLSQQGLGDLVIVAHHGSGKTGEFVEVAQSLTSVVEGLTPEVEPRVVGVDALLQARRNAVLRTDFIREVEHFTSAQIADLAESKASNRSALAHRWRAEGKVLGVEWRDQWLFPRFQFDEISGRPKPEIAATLTPFRRAGSSDWEVAAWFTGRHPWLRARPIDIFESEPKRVVQAAERSFDSPT
jgi:hypothetical protein